ncbi:hypothetical protein AGMMS50230_22180 [Spirochaetia bacterium]|nr:hypothetical protein AGMMS50230_22180 [Spirochaetia bacterium]
MVNGSLFLAALAEARRTGLAVSCHCDLNGENAAVNRAIEFAEQSGARLHIAHVSTKEAAEAVRRAKKRGLAVSCEVTPHHLALTEKDAETLETETHGKVSPPLRSEEDRRAIIAAIADGTVDAIATDHAPHTRADKQNGAPGFTGLETAFAVCYSVLAAASFPGQAAGASLIDLSKLSSLMSAAPARLLGLGSNADNVSAARGLVLPGFRADFCLVNTTAKWMVQPAAFMSRGKNSPFAGKELQGSIVMTIRGGSIVFDGSLQNVQHG